MAGGRDTPEQRRRRDEAMTPSEEDEALIAASDEPTEPAARRTSEGGRPNALVASAMRVRVDDRKMLAGLRRRRQAWQSEAWDYFDEVPEVGFTVTYLGNLISKVRLFAATRPDPASAPVPVDDADSGIDPKTAQIAIDTLERLQSPQGGQSALIREMSINFEVCGEALDLDTLVATPTGFARIGDLVAGDEVLGGDGRPCRVVVAHPVHDDRDCYEVRLGGDVSVVADGEHLWLTHSQRDRQYARQWGRSYEPDVVTTVQMAATVHSDAGSGTASNHAIELAAIEGIDVPLPLDPYVLGYWLGDGTSSQGNITVHHDDQPHLRAQIEAAGFGWSPRLAESGRGFQIGILGLQRVLRKAGLLNNKHIPAAYLRHTEQTRWALLQGLIDSDGHIDRRGRVEFSNTNQELLWGVVELAASLGLRPGYPSRHRVGFNSAGCPVARLPRKAERIAAATEQDRWRYVKSVEQVKSRPVRCITVDSDDGTFLVTPHFVRTHNCYLHGHEDSETGDEDWQIRSVDELVPDGEWFGLRTGLGSRTLEPVATDDVIIRLWERHPRFSMLASCSMRRVLADCESLLLLSREIRATAKSRLSNGFLLKPAELSFGAINPTQDPSDGEGTNDPFDDDLNETMITAVQEEGSAAAIVPITITGPAEYLKEFRHVQIQRPIDASLDKRIEGLVMRIARGLNAPVEVTTGLAETTFANAAQVKQDEFDAHIEPRCTMECDALTAGYYQPALEEAGVDHDLARRIFIWFDPAAAVASPDPADNAEKAHEDGVISDEARRRYQGYTEADAPTDDELLRRILLHTTRLDPNVLAQLLVITGLAPGIVVPPAAGTPAIDATTAVVASARLSDPRNLGRRLMEIDRDLRTRTQVAAEAALRRALERAGNRIRTSVQRDRSGETSALRRVADSTPSHLVASALGRPMVAAAGLTDGDLLDGQFDDVADEFAARATSARRRALAAVAAVYGPLADATAAEIDTQGDAATATARDWLVGALVALAASRLYAAETTSAAKGEVTAGVPAGVARAAVAIAGGAQVATSTVPGETDAVRTVSGSPVGGVATGPLVLDAAGPIEAWEWDYGTADRAPFEPHLDVDGLIFTSWDAPELLNPEGWPDTYLAPGDHGSCQCDSVPVLVGPTGDTTVDTGDGA